MLARLIESDIRLFLQEQGASPDGPILFAPLHSARHLTSHRLNSIVDQIGTHVIIESDKEDLSHSVTKRKTAANPRTAAS
jgi:hypothetical protein